MRKLIITGMALAMLAIPAVASADVPRHQTQDATFTVTQPAGEVGNWSNLWTHPYKVTVNPCDNTFTGTGSVSGHDQNGEYHADETITGKFGNGSVTLAAMRADGVEYKLANAAFGGDVTIATLNVSVPWAVEMKVSEPVFSNTSTYKNHGQYVKEMGGGSDAAHSCIGMPINSNK